MNQKLLTIFLIIISLPVFGVEAIHKPDEIKNKKAVEIYEKYGLKEVYNYFYRKSDNTMFNSHQYAGNFPLMDILMTSPSSKKTAENYYKNLQTAQGLFFGGLGIAFLGTPLVILAIISLVPPSNILDISSVIGFGVGFVGGFTMMVIGSVYLDICSTQVREAVWQYNKDLVTGVTKISQNGDSRFNVSIRGKF